MTYEGAKTLTVYNELNELPHVESVDVWQEGRKLWVQMTPPADANDVCRVQNVAKVNGYRITDATPRQGHINAKFKLEKEQ